MAYYDTINLVSGDDKPELNFILRDSNTAIDDNTVLDQDDPTTWAPINLLGKQVNVHFRLLGSTEVIDTLICGLIGDGSTGECYMHWNAHTLEVPAGTYEGEIEIIGPGNDVHPDGSSHGSTQTIFDKLKFKVRAGF